MNTRRKPRYQQVKDLIIDQISCGSLRPNDRVPSENELVEATGVSRMTANRALRELTSEGYVERIAGSGTFVADLKATVASASRFATSPTRWLSGGIAIRHA